MLKYDFPPPGWVTTASYSHLTTKPELSFRFHLRYLAHKLIAEHLTVGTTTHCYIPVCYRFRLGITLTNKRVWVAEIKWRVLLQVHTEKMTTTPSYKIPPPPLIPIMPSNNTFHSLTYRQLNTFNKNLTHSTKIQNAIEQVAQLAKKLNSHPKKHLKKIILQLLWLQNKVMMMMGGGVTKCHEAWQHVYVYVCQHNLPLTFVEQMSGWCLLLQYSDCQENWCLPPVVDPWLSRPLLACLHQCMCMREKVREKMLTNTNCNSNLTKSWIFTLVKEHQVS